MDATCTVWPKWGRSFSSLFLISWAVLAAYGCDRGLVGLNELVEVRGQVFLDGDPVAGARIVFVPNQAGLDRNARLSYGTSGVNGEFSLRLADDRIGAFPGLNRVVISKAEFKQAGPEIKFDEDVAVGNGVLAQVSNDFIGQPLETKVSEQIPFYYNSQSELACELIPRQGIQRVRFDLFSIDPLLKK